MIKKNAELAMRENEVLKRENAQYKSETEKLTAQVQVLAGELEALNAKYDEDVAKLNDAYENLCDHFTALELESDKKIQTLTESNAALEKRISDEVLRLNALLEDQKAAFQSERDLLKSESHAKVNGLEEKLSIAKKESAEKDTAIESLKKDHQKDQAQVTALEKTVRDQNEKIKDSETKFRDIQASHQQLQKQMDEKQTIIDQLNAKLKGLTGSPDQAPGQQ
jgi:chromosome segregation ATPase